MKQKLELKDKLMFALLGALLTGVGWLIIQNAEMDKDQNDRLDRHEIMLIEHSNILKNVIEAYNGKADKDKTQDSAIEKQRDEILELWKCTKRGGGGISQVLKSD